MKVRCATTASLRPWQFAGALAVFAVSAEAAVPVERVVENLCARPVPGDPLPAVRPNQPAARELVRRGRPHPFLLFDPAERGTLRARLDAEPARSLFARLRQNADRCREWPIPPQATMRDDLPMFLPDGTFNPAYAREEYATAFFRQSYQLREALTTLAFAFQLTGEAAYRDAAKRWLLAFAARDKFAPRGREADFHAAQVVFALSLGYDWLWEALADRERKLVREKLRTLAAPMHRAAVKLLAYPRPQEIRGALGGNHVRRTQGLYAVAPLALLHEVPEAADWLDTQIALHRDRLYPSAFAPNGEHVDMADHFNTSIDDPMVFTVALKHMGGEDLLNDPSLAPRFAGLAAFYLFGLEEWFGDGPTNRHGWNGPGENHQTAGWLALARHRRDEAAQWIATHDNGLTRLDPVLALLFHDPSVAAVRPTTPAGSLLFPFSGQVRLCTNWERDGLLVSLRCGPRIPKDSGDQNALRLRFADEWLLPGPPQVDRTKEQGDDFIYDLMAWYRGSPACNLVLPAPDGVDDYRGFQITGRIASRGGIQWGVYSIMDESFAEGSDRPDIPPHRQWLRRKAEFEEWLSGPETPKTGELRIVHLGDEFDYFCGEVHRAYHFLQPSLSLRHVLLVKGGRADEIPYLLICDELESGGAPLSFAWQIHPAGALTVQRAGMTATGRRGDLAVKWLVPASGTVVRRQTPAPLAHERTEFIQLHTGAKQSHAVFLTALWPGRSGANAAAPVFRSVAAAGGWAVEVSTAAGRDVALFRSERADTVQSAGVICSGSAAVLRQRGRGEPILYILGSHASKAAGSRNRRPPSRRRGSGPFLHQHESLRTTSPCGFDQHAG